MYIPVGKSKIGYHVLKVVDDNIGPPIWHMDHEAINQSSEDEVILMLDHDVYLWDELTYIKWENLKKQKGGAEIGL